MSYDKKTILRIREALKGSSGLIEKEMFGGIGFLLFGNMACGVIKDEMVVRVGPHGYEEALLEPHTRPFDYIGRPMRGWVVVSPEGFKHQEDLQNWVALGVNYASTLPAK